jgi:hypothetical protein
MELLATSGQHCNKTKLVGYGSKLVRATRRNGQRDKNLSTKLSSSTRWSDRSALGLYCRSWWWTTRRSDITTDQDPLRPTWTAAMLRIPSSIGLYAGETSQARNSLDCRIWLRLADIAKKLQNLIWFFSKMR